MHRENLDFQKKTCLQFSQSTQCQIVHGTKDV